MTTNTNPDRHNARNDPARRNPRLLANLDRMDGHMVPVIEEGDYLVVETDKGDTFIVPEDLVSIPDGLSLDSFLDPENNQSHSATLRACGQFMPEGVSGYPESAEYKQGFLARMSAPGYMDCTDWEAHDTWNDAARSLIENYAD